MLKNACCDEYINILAQISLKSGQIATSSEQLSHICEHYVSLGVAFW